MYRNTVQADIERHFKSIFNGKSFKMFTNFHENYFLISSDDILKLLKCLYN